LVRIMEIKVILNPEAGQAWLRMGIDPSSLIRESFEKEGHYVEIYFTTCAGDATRAAGQAAEEGFDVVIAAGGDGTVNEVVNGLVGKSSSLGVIPMGTENVLAKAMNLPLLDLKKACQHILNSPPRKVDVGKMGERCFLLFAGIGLDAHVLTSVPPQAKKTLGSVAFFFIGLARAWKYKNLKPEAIITVEGKEERFPFWLILVCNIPSYAWKLKVAPDALMDDGFLDVCIFIKEHWLGVLWQILGVFAGVHIKFPAIKLFKTKEIKIASDPPVKVQIDGETIGYTPQSFTILPRALSVRF
jgi:diacylglycerol kinase (ATP)